MTKLKTIVVEDERLPRLSLLAKLGDFSKELDVIDSCESYTQARESILLNRPDLLFLDIQLQGRDSIKLLEELRQIIPLPYIIFTTAYSDKQYLLSAIKLSAVDYLLKPVGKAELALAISKARNMFQKASEANTPSHDKLTFKSVNSKIFVAPEDIAYFRAEGNYSTVVTFGREDLALESLLSLERRLPPKDFLRIDRSTIVNVKNIYKLDQHGRSCLLQSKDNRQIEVKLSKSGMENLLSKLS
jgi:DNA-binding LytR/AlgR family response regulator